MVELGVEGPFKRPGEVPFHWEIQPGIPKIRTQPDNGLTLLHPPKKLSPLLITKLPQSPSFSPPAVSPFTPPPPPFSSFRLKPRQDSTPYCRCSSARAPTRNSAATVLRRLSLVKSLLGFKKNKTHGDVKNTGLDSQTTSSESDIFYDAETRFSPPSKSSLLSSFGMKRTESDLSSSEKRITLMMDRERLTGMW